jgi:hypothetical protein
MRTSVREKGIRRFEVTNAGSLKLSRRSAQPRLEPSWFHEPIREITNPILFLPIVQAINRWNACCSDAVTEKKGEPAAEVSGG